MDFLADGTKKYNADDRFNEHYPKLRSLTGLSTADIFFMCAVIGYREGKQDSNYRVGKTEFRPSYLDAEQRAILYSIAFNELGEEPFSELENLETQKQIVGLLQLYANGGMDYLLLEVFKEHTIDGHFVDSYIDYDTDLIKMIYDKLIDTPF